MVSALTLFGLREMTARYASYEDLAEIIRHRFMQPGETLKELYGRLVFNILCGNTDDHASNHSAFWNGKELALTPAYDICPQGRTGNEATQAMLITGENRFSQLKTCLAAAHHFFLSRQAAVDAIDRIETAIRDNWERVCEEAELSPVDKNYLWGHQFFNPFSIER
jgi:serine/threonine-protein kinase HipA